MAAAGSGTGCPNQYWIALLGGTGTQDVSSGVEVDSECNIIVSGWTNSDGAGGYDLLVAKYDSSGTLQWSRTLGGTGTDLGYNTTIDSSDNIIVVGYTNSDGAGAIDGLIAKYNSSGTLQWDRTLGRITYNDIFQGVTVDSSDNIIVCGYTQTSTTNYGLFAKYNSSGTLQWQKGLGASVGVASVTSFRDVKIDSSDNIIVVGATLADGAGGTDALIAKYNSSGTLQWDRTLGGTGTDTLYSISVDSSDNIIVVGHTNSDGEGNDDVLIAKYNSSGTLQWDRILGGIIYDQGRAVTIDSSDNIIITGYTASDGEGNQDILIAKYNSSGTFQWSKSLGGTGNDYGTNVRVDSSDNIIVVGYTNSDGAGGNDALIAKLPPDGEVDGTYGSLVYQDAVLTDAEAVLTDAEAVLTNYTFSLTDAEAVLTDDEAVLTEEFFEITT